MLSVEDAQQGVATIARPLPIVRTPLHEVLGLVLAEDVRSDLDMPPHDKALVDGFAIRAEDLVQGRGEFAVVGKITAGQPPWESSARLAPGQAVQIMTGAPIPPGADAVVMVERTAPCAAGTHEGRRVAVHDPGLKAGRNIMRQGLEMTRGQVVLEAGRAIRPQEVSVLAAVGQAEVSVFPRPRVAVISTGNEVVETHQSPGPGQIRNSNGPTLLALITRAGGKPDYLGIARDTSDDLRRLLEQGLESDLLLLSGGVSAGDFDLVPAMSREMGVREVFHKVNMKPGKPLWFGTLDRKPQQDRGPTLVFGLPGNPVSVMVCFELFVRPAIRQVMGFPHPAPRIVHAALAADWLSRSDRPTYYPARLESPRDAWHVLPVTWKGSADMRSVTEANAFIIFPPGERQFRAGEHIQVLCME